jgi:hypothetical protein
MTTADAIFRKWNFRGRRGNLPWFSYRGNRNELAELFGELGFNKGVEIGTRKGEYARVLCQKNPKLLLTCIDPWLAYNGKYMRQDIQDRLYDIAVKNLNGLNVEIIRKKSMDAVGDFKDKSLDFVYIDGNHSFDYAIMDIIHWVPKVRTEGIVAIHDYHHGVGADVVKAIDAYTHCHHIDPWYITREIWPTAFWVKK